MSNPSVQGKGPEWQKIRRKTSGSLLNIIFLLITFTCLFPVIWIGYTSFKPLLEYNKSIIRLPMQPTLENYQLILKTAKFGTYFTNSGIVSIVTLLIVLLCSVVTGYFLSRFRFKGRNLIYGFLVLGVVVPTHAWMLPVFIQFRTLGLLDKRLTLIFPYVAFALPTAIFLIESYVRGLPEELEESAMMEGCSVWESLARIIIPLCKPIMATVTILTFNGSWNEFPFALVLINKNAFKTVPVALTMFTGAYTTNYPMLVAALGIALLPVVLLYLFSSGRIMEGMVAGAVKG